ncbi:GNAT family N-acetyltransferase [Streptomyces sp. NPDC049879]|uniref:GNAT family N-acetyltransferase n=1 Tax=Streptomyces sp. NPDC049879 TaxID=3365598 RepID=UPI00378E7CD6
MARVARHPRTGAPRGTGGPADGSRTGRCSGGTGHVISLRDLTRADVPAVRLIYDVGSVAFLPRGPMGEDEALAYVRTVGRDASGARSVHTFGVDADGDLVGVVRLRVSAPHGHLSYILRRDAWGHGHATRAVTLLLAFAFGSLGLSAVHAKHHPDNERSGRVLSRVGFVRTAAAGRESCYVLCREAYDPCPPIAGRE